MKFTLAAALICILVSGMKADDKNASLKNDRDLQVFQYYLNMDKKLRQFVDRGVRKMLPYVLESMEQVNISSTCMDNLFQLMSGLRKLTEWSINFLDATGKPQSGILAGNIQMFGEYKQCFDTVVKKKGKIDFRGQYCSVIVKPILPHVEDFHVYYEFKELSNLTSQFSGLMQSFIPRLSLLYLGELKIGVCIPSGCRKEDISEIFDYLSENIFLNMTVYHCFKKEDLHYWTNARIIAASVFGVLGILAIAGTILGNYLEKRESSKLSLTSKIILCFSITRNFPKLINTDTSPGAITCLYGIRVLSLFWITLCHEYVAQFGGTAANHILDMEIFIRKFFSQIIMNGFIAVDVFFALGGFVNCYSRMKIKLSGKSQPSTLKIMIHRLWRIYPTYIICILAYILLSSFVPQYYHLSNTMIESCRKYWWKNLIFINNFYSVTDMCLPHSWYIAADMQIFLMSLITIPVLLRNEKFGIYLHVAVILLTNIGCFIFWWIQDASPTPVHWQKFNKSNMEYGTHIYNLPFTHITSYYTGILIGYVIAMKKPKRFSKVYLTLGWLAASFFFTSVIFMTYRWQIGLPHSKLERSLYASLSKSILILCVSWMIYCCITHQARLVNYILSLKIWIPLSRLSYMAYLISVTVQFYYNTNLNFPPDFARIFLIWSYFGNLCITLLLSLALVLTVESPFLELEKIFFRRRQEENKSLPEPPNEIALNGKVENVSNENNTISSVHM